jgi:hypothetical protein
MNAYMGGQECLHAFLASGIGDGECSASCPKHFAHGGNSSAYWLTFIKPEILAIKQTLHFIFKESNNSLEYHNTQYTKICTEDRE